MERRSFLQNKLWRDKAVDFLKSMNSIIHWKRLEDTEYNHQLREKLLEEATEVITSKSKQELIQELADLLEVIEALSKINGVSLEDVRLIQAKKREERGGFEGRKFVTVAEHLPGSFGEKYYLANPQKYPEIQGSENTEH